MTKRILIAGCGDIGTAVGANLVRLGHQVVGLRRRSVHDETGIDYVQADLTCPDSFSKLDVHVDLILVIVTPTERSPQGYETIYMAGVGNLLGLFAGQGVRPPVLYVSSTRVYGQNAGEWIDENSETSPLDACGKILLAAEKQVLGCWAGNTIVRFSGIYGPGRAHLLSFLESGKAVQYSPPHFANRVHRDDCVGALLFLIGKSLSGEPLLPHYLISDDEPVPKWEVLAWLADQKGLPKPRRQIVGMDEGQGKRCCNRRIRDAGYRFKYPSFREGYSALLLG